MLRFAIIGAGMAGHPQRRSSCAKPASTTSPSTRRPTARRHLAREHLSRARVRRAVAPLLLLVRAEPGLEPPLLAGRRDPRLLRAGRGRPRRRPARPLRRRGRRAARSSDGRWQLETATGPPRRGRRRDRRDRRAAPPERSPTSRGSTSFAGALFHSARWDHVGAARRRARRRHRHRLDRACRSSSALVDRVAQLSLFQRTAQWIMPQENPPYTDEEKARVPRRSRAAARTMHDAPRRGVRRVRQRGRRRGLAADEDDRGAVPREPRAQRARPRAARAAAARLPRRAASGWSSRPTSTRRSSARTPSSSPTAIERIEPAGVRTRDGVLHELDVLVLATGFHADASCARWRSPAATARTLDERVAPRPDRVPVDLDPRLPELLHAQRPERTGRQLLADRGRRAAVRATSCSSSSCSAPAACREISADEAATERVRGRARRGGAEHRSGSPAAAAGTSTTAASPRRGRGRSTASARGWRRRSSTRSSWLSR